MGRWRIFVAGAMTLVMPAIAAAQAGLTYQFKSEQLSGRVWVLGDDARREIEAGEDGQAAGRIEIWKDGGKQVFVLNSRDRTYYDDVAMRARLGISPASVDTLTVRAPFRVETVEDVRLDLRTLPTGRICGGLPLPALDPHVFVSVERGVGQ